MLAACFLSGCHTTMPNGTKIPFGYRINPDGSVEPSPYYADRQLDGFKYMVDKGPEYGGLVIEYFERREQKAQGTKQ